MKINAYILTAGVGLLFSLLSSCTDAVQPPLRFAMEATYPPFVFMDAQNQIQGFEVDLARALCKELQRECTFTHQNFDSLIINLKLHRYDVIISGLDITPVRAKQVAFTLPYFHNPATFVVRRGVLHTLAQLTGRRIGVQSGSTHQQYLLTQCKKLHSIPYDSYQNGLLDLNNGRLDALFCDAAIVTYWLKNNPSLVALDPPIVDTTYFGKGMAMAVRHGDSALLEQLNNALTTLKQSGQLTQLQKKWL